STDLAGRYGGDEFVVLLVRTALAGAERVAELMRSTVLALGPALGYPAGMVSVSIGVAGFNPRAPSREDILVAADRALYEAKAKGGNVVMKLEGPPPITAS